MPEAHLLTCLERQNLRGQDLQLACRNLLINCRLLHEIDQLKKMFCNGGKLLYCKLLMKASWLEYTCYLNYSVPGNRGGGEGLPYKSDGGDCRPGHFEKNP